MNSVVVKSNVAWMDVTRGDRKTSEETAKLEISTYFQTMARLLNV